MRTTILVGFAVSVLSVVGTGFAKAETCQPRAICLANGAETCSHRRAICLAGERSREYTPPPGQISSCKVAWPYCIKTGVWQTFGGYGRTIYGMTRR
jgi:hypothetical protein